MKRAEPRIILRPGLPQLDVVTHDANDVGLLLKSFFKVGRGAHGDTHPSILKYRVVHPRLPDKIYCEEIVNFRKK